MNIQYVDNSNYDKVISFLEQQESEDINQWKELLNQGLFKICAINENNEIESVFIFEDYPYSLQSKYQFITKQNWTNWLKHYFEVPNETYHTLWLTKWCTNKSRAFDVDLLKLLLSSLFITNHEVESILIAADSINKAEKQQENDQQTFNFAFQLLFNPLHRIHRKKKDEDTTKDESLLNVIDLYYCPSSKILPNIEIRKATVEDFDALMPLFQKESAYLQQRHGEFFLAELIESAQKDERLQTCLVAMSNGKPVGFVCFSTNVDLISLRNSFYLEQFDDFEDLRIDFPKESAKYDRKIEKSRRQSMKWYDKDEIIKRCENDDKFAELVAGHIMHFYSEKEWLLEQEELLKQSPDDDENYTEFIKLGFDLLEEVRYIELEKYVNSKIMEYKKDDALTKPKELRIDTSLNTLSGSIDTNEEQKNTTVIVANLLCIDSNYVYAAKVFAQTIFNYYPNCEYLLSTTVHDQATPNYLNYFCRVYPKPCIEYPYDLYLTDKNALNATISIRPIDFKLDIEQLKQIIDESVPNRQKYLTNPNNDDVVQINVYHCYAVIVDYKIIGVVYIENIDNKKLFEFNKYYDLKSSLKNVDKLNAKNTAKLEFMTLNPIFNVNVKGILREIMRQIEIDTLFYYYIPHYCSEYKDYNLPDPQSCVIENFVQLKPKKFVYSKLSQSNQTTYSLYTFSRQFYAETQEIINHRIVIIGNNDDCCYGLIQYLITQKDLKFTNLTLINTVSSNTDNNEDKIKYCQHLNRIKRNTFLFKSHIVSDSNNGDYLQKLCIDNKLCVIMDNISGLDVTKKCVHLQESGICLYDILVFANGLGPVNIIPQIKYLPKDKKSKKHDITNESLFDEIQQYQNILLTSPEIEDDIMNLEIYIEQNDIANTDDNIIIYGDSINMICIINHLISKYQIEGNRIIMIKCLSSTSSQIYFKNEKLNTIIQQQLKDYGVKILENVIPVGFIKNKYNRYLIDAMQWKQNENQEINAMIVNEQDGNNNDQDAEFDAFEREVLASDVVKLKINDDSQSGLSYYSLSCQLCILCQNEISFDTLQATNQNPFVIDGQIVVDDQFRTQDSSIYATGNIAKFSRKFTNNDNGISFLQYANSFSIGQQCAKFMVDHILDPLSEDDSSLIDLQKETCVVAKLIGEYHYFYAYNPEFVLNGDDRNDENIKRFESCDDKQMSMVSFDVSGYLKEILYYGVDWKPEWIKCANALGLPVSFFQKALAQFEENTNGTFVNICEIFHTKAYELMMDDRFKNWVANIKQNDKSDKDQMKNEIHLLIKEIAKEVEE